MLFNLYKNFNSSEMMEIIFSIFISTFQLKKKRVKKIESDFLGFNLTKNEEYASVENIFCLL